MKNGDNHCAEKTLDTSALMMYDKYETANFFKCVA